MTQVILTTESRLQELIADAIRPLARAPSEVVDSTDKDWLNNSEARNLLGLSKSTLQRYRAEGKIPYSKLFGNIRYRRTDIENMLSRNLRIPSAEVG